MKRLWRLCGLVTGWLFGRESYDKPFPTREPRAKLHYDGKNTVAELLKRLK